MAGVLTDVAIGVLAISSRSGTGGRVASLVTGVGVDVHPVRDIDPDEPANMRVLSAFELNQAAPQRFCLKDVAWKNIRSMWVTLDTSHLEMSPSKDSAPLNIPAMSVTLDTSHFDMSALNDSAPLNRRSVSVTVDTSHVLIGPCRPFEQSPSGDNSRQVLTASSSSTLDIGMKISFDVV